MKEQPQTCLLWTPVFQFGDEWFILDISKTYGEKMNAENRVREILQCDARSAVIYREQHGPLFFKTLKAAQVRCWLNGQATSIYASGGE